MNKSFILFMSSILLCIHAENDQKEQGLQVLKTMFSEKALEEFSTIVKFTENRPKSLFPKCRSSRPKKKTDCFGSDTKYFYTDVPGLMKKADCLEPTESQIELINVAVTMFVDNTSLSIIKQRADQCGATCQRKLSCCGSKRNFYLQGLVSQSCKKRSCLVDQLTKEEMDLLGVSDVCDFGKVGFPDWNLVKFGSNLMGEGLGEMNKRLMCTLFGVHTPRMNCIRANQKCRCCCHDKKPVGRYCVPLKSNECKIVK